jgi:uncharacterized protein YecA (UPF0149 family)
MTILEAVKRVIAGPEHQPLPDLGRNDRCWCGSGRKYKTCHMGADDRKRAAARSNRRS